MKIKKPEDFSLLTHNSLCDHNRHNISYVQMGCFAVKEVSCRDCGKLLKLTKITTAEYMRNYPAYGC